MPRLATGNREIAAGERAGNHKRSGFDAIGNDAMPRAVQLVDAADANRMRARALNLRAHLVEQRRQVNHLRLARAILQDGLAFGQGRGHQQIFGSGDGNFLEDNCARP